jgi:hypothetical protein
MEADPDLVGDVGEREASVLRARRAGEEEEDRE